MVIHLSCSGSTSAPRAAAKWGRLPADLLHAMYRPSVSPYTTRMPFFSQSSIVSARMRWPIVVMFAPPQTLNWRHETLTATMMPCVPALRAALRLA